MLTAANPYFVIPIGVKGSRESSDVRRPIRLGGNPVRLKGRGR